MAQNKTSPYEEGRLAYADRQQNGGEHRKNPYEEFSGRWCEWNRGYNEVMFQKVKS